MAAKSEPSYKKFEIRTRNPDPKASILLVIDAQNYFSSMVKPILPSINTTIDLCRRASIPIAFTRHRHKSPADYGMLGEWWNNDLVLDGTPESELMPDLYRQPTDAVVEKTTYSAFRGTQLEERLREMGVEEVIVTGVMTNLCCETTAREAFVRGFRVFFSTDATATSDVELHEATLKNLAYGFAYLVDCPRIRDALSLNEGYFSSSVSGVYEAVRRSLNLGSSTLMSFCSDVLWYWQLCIHFGVTLLPALEPQDCTDEIDGERRVIELLEEVSEKLLSRPSLLEGEAQKPKYPYMAVVLNFSQMWTLILHYRRVNIARSEL